MTWRPGDLDTSVPGRSAGRQPGHARWAAAGPGCRGLAVGVAVLAEMFQPSPASSATLIVPTDYPTIQAAIDAAEPLDDVLVEPGTYRESLSLRSNVDVIGRETARTLLQPETTQVPTVRINAVSGVRFSNFTLINTNTAIEIVASSDIHISNVVFDTIDEVAISANALSVDIVNNVFFNSAVAVRRASVVVDIINNAFRGNDITITSFGALDDNDTNVAANCWSDNADLRMGIIDTGYGTGVVTGDPLFVAPAEGDFHLREGSPCIDAGLGNDVIDNTVADIGAYGGEFADARPAPVQQPTLTNTSDGGSFDIRVEWSPNLSYLVTSTVLPGAYRIHYVQNEPGPPYDGTDAAGGTQPSPIETGDVTTYTLTDLTPGAPALRATRLLSAAGFNESVTLAWEAVDSATGYRIRYGQDSTGEQQVDTGDVTTYTVMGLANGATYRFTVSALTRAAYHVSVTALDSTQDRHESDYSPEQVLSVGDVSEGPPSNELSALPQFTVAYPSLPDEGGCFIATAAFGADWQAEVQVLRDFRDAYLAGSAPGRRVVAIYYGLGPAAADALRAHPALKPAVRLLLTPFVVLALLLLASTPPVKATIGGLLLALLLVRIHGRRSRHAARPC